MKKTGKKEGRMKGRKEGRREGRKEGRFLYQVLVFQSGFLAFVALVTFVVFVASWLLRLLSSRLLGFLASLLLGDCCFWLFVFLAPCGFWLYAVYNDHIRIVSKVAFWRKIISEKLL